MGRAVTSRKPKATTRRKRARIAKIRARSRRLEKAATTKRKRARIAKIRARNRRLEKAALCDEWSESAAKCVGSSHIKTCTPCQDSVWAQSFDNGVSVVALADGAGSAKYSHYGSNLVAKRAVELVGEHFLEALGPRYAFNTFKDRLIQQLQMELLQLAQSGIDLQECERASFNMSSREDNSLVPCEIGDLSCTLLIVAVRGNQYFSIHLGDGVIGAEIEHRGDRRMKVISIPDNGEFANETHFITSRDAQNFARGFRGKLDTVSKKTTGFIMMSDGPESSLFDKRNQSLASACHKLIAANRELPPEEMNKQLEATLVKVISKKTSDDCSVALMSRRTKA